MGQVVKTRKNPLRRTALRNLGATVWKVREVAIRAVARDVGLELVSSLDAGTTTATAVGVLPLAAFSVVFSAFDVAASDAECLRSECKRV
jgi:hypothetical protein